jgi:hypothetical protein
VTVPLPVPDPPVAFVVPFVALTSVTKTFDAFVTVQVHVDCVVTESVIWPPIAGTVVVVGDTAKRAGIGDDDREGP